MDASIDEEEIDPSAVASLHAAAEAGDAAGVLQLLEAGVPAHAQEDEDGHSALMLAAGGGHGHVVELLLWAGAPWNAIDRRGRCAGNHALDNGHQPVVDQIVDAAVKAELLLGAAERASARAAAAKAAESDEYLSRASHAAPNAPRCDSADARA
jgi:protein arginine N-methyltransferase 2